jgi:release factor glutamine methyltransferase
VDLVSRLRAAGCVFAEEEAELLADADDEQIARRVAGEPLEHVLGWAEFRGRRVVVAPGVFVPRHRSELLVDLAVARVRPGAVVVDLCCGSGALGAAVAHDSNASLLAPSARNATPSIELHAVDLDPAAVACARRNVPGAVYEGDLDAPLPTSLRGRVDVLLASPPYVPTAEIARMPPEAREHEPLDTLDGGVDGLDLARRIAALAPGWLAPTGALLVECATHQGPDLAAAVRDAGLTATVHTDDDATTVEGRWPTR